MSLKKLEDRIPLSPALLLPNDDSSLDVSLQQRCILWAGLTAAKKTLNARNPVWRVAIESVGGNTRVLIIVM